MRQAREEQNNGPKTLEQQTMTPAEMVTDFKFLPGKTTKGELCKAIVAHLHKLGMVADEYDLSPISWSNRDQVAWDGFGRILAFVQEGGSEGYYIHLGTVDREARYETVGLAKMNMAEPSYKMGTEVQRFLCAMVWN